MNDHHVVLGTGPLGLAVVRELRENGAAVTAVNRSGDAPVPDDVDVRSADLSDEDQARDACADADVVYFCVNPPYTKWPALFPPLLENAIEAAAAADATLASHDEAMGEAWHVPSAETLTTRAFVERVREAAGSDSSVRSMPSWLYRVVSTVHAEMRELRETMNTFEEPFVVDHSKFEAAFGADPTPHDEAIERTLEWYRSEETA